MTSNPDIRQTIAKNQVTLEKIMELAKDVKLTTDLEAMLLVAVEQLSDSFKETLERLAEKIK